MKAKNLRAEDIHVVTGRSSDAYVAIHLINPDQKLNKKIGETNVIKKNLNPEWTDCTTNKLDHDYWSQFTGIEFCVFHSGIIKSTKLGAGRFYFKDILALEGSGLEYFYDAEIPLSADCDKPGARAEGTLQFRLSFSKIHYHINKYFTCFTLQFTVGRVENATTRVTETANMCIEVFIVKFDKSEKMIFPSSIKYGTTSPVWNETFLLDEGDWETREGIKFKCYDKNILNDYYVGSGTITFKELDEHFVQLPVGKIDIKIQLQNESTKQHSGDLHISLHCKSSLKIAEGGLKYIERKNIKYALFNVNYNKRLQDISSQLPAFFSTCCKVASQVPSFISAVAYEVWSMKGFKYFKFEEKEIAGYGMYDEKAIILCFRGSKGNTLSEIYGNWLRTNLATIMVNRDGQWRPEFQKKGIQVHYGFNDAIMGIWHKILHFVETAREMHPSAKLYLCGHSLGGALATMALALFTLGPQPHVVHGVFTIGQPRALNRTARDILTAEYNRITNNNGEFVRITNSADLVPHMPPKFYSMHMGVHIWFYKNEVMPASSLLYRALKITVNLSDRHVKLIDHAAASYLKRACNWCGMKSIMAIQNKITELIESIISKQVYLGMEISNVLQFRSFFRIFYEQIENFSKTVEELAKFAKQHTVNDKEAFLKALEVYSDDIDQFESLINQYKKRYGQMDEENFKKKLNDLHSNMFTSYLYFCKLMEVPPLLNKLDFNEIKLVTSSKQNDCHFSQLFHSASTSLAQNRHQESHAILSGLFTSNMKGVLCTADMLVYLLMLSKSLILLGKTQEAIVPVWYLVNYGGCDEILNDDLYKPVIALFKDKFSKEEEVKSKFSEDDLMEIRKYFNEADLDENNYLSTEEIIQFNSKGKFEEMIAALGWENVNFSRVDNLIEDVTNKYHGAVGFSQLSHLISVHLFPASNNTEILDDLTEQLKFAATQTQNAKQEPANLKNNLQEIIRLCHSIADSQDIKLDVD